MKVGIFKYQGGWNLFAEVFNELKVKYTFIKHPNDLDSVDSIIMHGGESSVQYLYLKQGEYLKKIKEFSESGKIIFATCAGMILLSNIETNLVKGLGLLDIDVERNFYGNQISSGQFKSDNGNEVEFIRAPKITRANNVEILDTYDKSPILVRKDNIIAATFHPEVCPLNSKNILVKIFK